MSEFIENKFWTVLPYDRVRHIPALQLSPAAVKDERDRKPRLPCDHSWSPVNETTSPHAPPEAMQFGGTLHRVLRQVRYANPKFGPTYLAKHDIKDGFYRMFLKASDCPRLAIILPRYPGEPQLIAIPMSCTMGWTQSPPTFSVMSETQWLTSPTKASPLHLATSCPIAWKTLPQVWMTSPWSLNPVEQRTLRLLRGCSPSTRGCKQPLMNPTTLLHPTRCTPDLSAPQMCSWMTSCNSAKAELDDSSLSAPIFCTPLTKCSPDLKPMNLTGMRQSLSRSSSRVTVAGTQESSSWGGS